MNKTILMELNYNENKKFVSVKTGKGVESIVPMGIPELIEANDREWRSGELFNKKLEGLQREGKLLNEINAYVVGHSIGTESLPIPPARYHAYEIAVQFYKVTF